MTLNLIHLYSLTPPRLTMAAVIDLTVMSHFNTPIPSGTVIDLTAEELHQVADACTLKPLTNKRARSTEDILPAKKKFQFKLLDAIPNLSSDSEADDHSDEDVSDLEDIENSSFLDYESDAESSVESDVEDEGEPTVAEDE